MIVAAQQSSLIDGFQRGVASVDAELELAGVFARRPGQVGQRHRRWRTQRVSDSGQMLSGGRDWWPERMAGGSTQLCFACEEDPGARAAGTGTVVPVFWVCQSLPWWWSAMLAV